MENTKPSLLAAVFDNEHAYHAVEELVEKDFPMGKISVLHRMGIPADQLDRLHQDIMDDKTVVLLHPGHLDLQTLTQDLQWQHAEEVMTLPPATLSA